MYRSVVFRLLTTMILFSVAVPLAAADFPLAKKKRKMEASAAPVVIENEGPGDSPLIPEHFPAIGKPAKQWKNGQKLVLRGVAVAEPGDSPLAEIPGPMEDETSSDHRPDVSGTPAQPSPPLAKLDHREEALSPPDGLSLAIARRNETSAALDDEDDEPDLTSVPGKKAALRPEKLPFEGWDEYHATLAIHQWLKQNPTFSDLAPTEQEDLTDHFLRIMFSGEMNPSVIRGEIRGQRFQGTASVLRAPLVDRLPDRLLFDYSARNFGGEPEAHRITVPAPVGPRNISVASPEFPLWLENALRQPTAEKDQPIDWKIFPHLKNRYGRTITPRMYVMSVILIESAGIHRRKDKLYNAQGFYGFMQLGASYKRWQVSDPQNNLLHGVRHLYPCLHKTLVQDDALRDKSPAEDRLIMASVSYNRGRYSEAAKLTWRQLLKETPATPFQKKKYYGLHDNRVAVKYGIQTKAYLGLPLTRDEKSWIREFTGVKDVDDWCERKYSSLRNAILGRVRLSEKYGS